MEATGGVTVTRGDQTATGDKAVFDSKDDTVTLSAAKGGVVTLKHGNDVAKGEQLVVHLGSGESQLVGSKGAN